jgi:hypothetical protein
LRYSLADLEAVIEADEKSPLKRSRMVAQLRKRAGKFGLQQLPYESLPHSLQWNLCRLRLSRGQWDWQGWELRSDWAFGIRSRQPIPFWDGRPCNLLLIAEEGVGDEIMALSCLSDLISETPVTVECDERLIEVVKRSFGVNCIPRQHDWEIRREFDAFLPMLDLLPRYRKSPKDCPGTPFLVPDKARVQYWRETLPSHVGAAFKGRHGSLRKRPPGVSLQYGDPECPVDAKADFADLINLVAALDRVVSCPQSVVHVAGALGIPTEVHMPPRGSGEVNNTLHWRYLCGMPFYSSVRVM